MLFVCVALELAVFSASVWDTLKFEMVYPAAGDDHSAVRFTIPELEKAADAQGWIDVCKEEA